MPPSTPSESPASSSRRRANDLEGKEWTRNSISVWSDIRKDAEELALKHPAVYPKALVRRCLDCFTRADESVVLDPFSGSGSTVLAAAQAGKIGVGFEINPDYVALTHRRYADLSGRVDAWTGGRANESGEAASTRPLIHSSTQPLGGVNVIEADARLMGVYLQPGSVDICVTSPPYWNILTQKRSADRKDVRNYGDRADDLGRVADYQEFVASLVHVFAAVRIALKPGGYCLINVMDLRKGPVFYPLHSDLASALVTDGWEWDDLIIWDRRAEYNLMRPLGFPTRFRINKAHEFVMIMRNYPKDEG